MQPQLKEEITSYKQLPLILTTTDIMMILRCSRPSALQIIKTEGHKKKNFFVTWVGNSPRVSRDSFLKWLKVSLEEKEKEVTPCTDKPELKTIAK